MPPNKTQPTKVSATAFIAALPDLQKRADANKIIKLIKTVLDETPKMWGPSIIGFGSYHYVYNTGREGDMPLIAFSPRKTAIVFYGLAGAGCAPLLTQLGTFTTGKSCLYVKKLTDINLTILEEIIRKSVAATRARYPT